jgi:iron complex outermembrane recepter protein
MRNNRAARTHRAHFNQEREVMWRNGRSKINARAGAGSGNVRRAVALALASAAAASSAFAQEASDNSQVMQLEDIVIVGSRLKKSGITESHNPVTVFTATDIARTGASNISDVLEYLPSKTFGPNEQNTASAALIAQLRGLTIGNTLVLINGRRTTSTASLAGAAGGTAFNLNTIPLSAVERIEILSDSASAVYGSDAVGGVVNIVLKSSISEPFVSAYYGKAEGGADERRGSAGFGYDGDRLRVSVIADYFKRDYLLGAERDQYANQDYRNQGGTDFRNTAARLANIRTQNGANLPGLNSPNATVPAGSTGVGLTPADFTATAGTTNRESLLAFASIVPASERKSAMTLAEFSFTDRLRMFGEVFYADQNDERRTNPGTIPNGTVTADQAFNPFDVPLTVQYVFPDAVVNFSENELIRGVLGLRGAITSSWDFEVYGLTSSENGAVSAANQVNAVAAAAALRSTNAATALNVFTAAP